MNKKIILIIFGLFLITTVLAIEKVDIFYKIKIEYNPNCLETCQNITLGNNTVGYLNVTNCNYTCTGTIKILGIEDNHLTIIENLEDISGTEIYTGFFQAEIGNQTDITHLFDKVETCMSMLNQTDKLNKCMASNSNISVQLMMCKRDIGFESNYTSCNTERTTLKSQITTKDSTISSQSKDIDDLKRGKTMNYIIGFIIGIISIKYLYPKVKGTMPPKDEAERGFANTAY